jgi:hypothetical protein
MRPIIRTSALLLPIRLLRSFLAQSGRAFTDDLEREISQRLLTSNWSVNAGAFNYRRFP